MTNDLIKPEGQPCDKAKPQQQAVEKVHGEGSFYADQEEKRIGSFSITSFWQLASYNEGRFSNYIMKKFWSISLTLFVMGFLTMLAWAAKDFTMPPAHSAKGYPAHDEHSMERVTIAADPYDTPEKAKIFSEKYSEIGFLPVYFVVTNDSDEPISLADVKPEYVTSDRTKIQPASEDDISRRISRPQAKTTPSPIPFPTKKVKGGMSEQVREEIHNSRFAAMAVEPHTTQAGFLFFDISDISEPLAGAHFYLTGVRDANDKDLMYFDVSMDDYVNPPKP